MSSSRLAEIIGYNKDIFAKLAVYSVAMFIAGIGCFFVVGRGPLPDLFGLSRSQRDVAGALAGVLATNIVIALYVWSAFAEDVEARAAPGDAAAALPPPPAGGAADAAAAAAPAADAAAAASASASADAGPLRRRGRARE